MSDLKPIKETYCETCGEVKEEPHRHIADTVKPIKRLCDRCGKLNLELHICVPKALQCPTCGKPTAEIATCTGHICPICGGDNTPPHWHIFPGTCPICGQLRTYDHGCLCTVCGKPYAYGINHNRCLTFQPRCPICGGPNTAGHACIYMLCPTCGEPKTEGHKCIRVTCPICGRVRLIGSICPCILIQKVIAEKELPKYLADGWVLKMQLQSGDVLMEKEIDVETITTQVMEQTNKQITDELSKADAEKITAKAMEQATKQIAEAVEKERQRLLLKE